MPGWFDSLIASGAITGTTGPSQAIAPQQPQRFTGMLSPANNFSPEAQQPLRNALQQRQSTPRFTGMLSPLNNAAPEAQAQVWGAMKQRNDAYPYQQIGGMSGMLARILSQAQQAGKVLPPKAQEFMQRVGQRQAPQQSSPWSAIAQGAGTLGAAMGGGMRKPTTQPTTISVMSPDGETREVPSEQAQYFIQRGARRIG